MAVGSHCWKTGYCKSRAQGRTLAFLYVTVSWLQGCHRGRRIMGEIWRFFVFAREILLCGGDGNVCHWMQTCCLQHAEECTYMLSIIYLNRDKGVRSVLILLMINVHFIHIYNRQCLWLCKLQTKLLFYADINVLLAVELIMLQWHSNHIQSIHFYDRFSLFHIQRSGAFLILSLFSSCKQFSLIVRQYICMNWPFKVWPDCVAEQREE